MVELRPWIDLTPTRQGAATASQLTQVDRSVMAVVSGTPESDPSVPAGMVEVTIPESVEPPAVVPADGGITSLGAEVLCKRDSSGRITSASTPTRLPAGAQPVAVGVTGEWLASLDALTSSLDAAQSDLNQAQTQLKEHLATLGIDMDNVTVTDELWARLAVFAKVTTDMLIAGGAVITGDMIVDNLVGKNLYGAYIGGGELLIQGESADPPTTGVITRFETSGDDELWANILTSTGVSRVTGGRSGYMLQSVAAPDSDGNVQNRVNTRYNNALSPWVSAINSIPLAGSTTLSVWVKSSVADTLSVIWFKWLDANGNNTLVKRDVDVAANTWTEVTLTGPAGYRPVLGLLGVLPLFTIFGTKVSSTQSRTLWVDDLTWSNKLATSSSLHLFRDASGTPTIQVTGGDSDSGVITLSAPTGAMAQLEFATADGTSSTKMTADGIAMTTAGRTDAASWTGVADTVSPILIKTTPKDIASGLYTDWFDIPYGQTFEEPPLLEGYLSPAGDIVKSRVLPYGATTSTFNLRVYNDGTQNKNGVVAWIIVRPVRSFKITNM